MKLVLLFTVLVAMAIMPMGPVAAETEAETSAETEALGTYVVEDEMTK